MRTLGLGLAIGLWGLLGLAPTAAALEIYTYTGNTYDSVSGSYTTSMRITGSIQTPVPLGPNLILQDVSAGILSYSFNDGLQTLAGGTPAAASFLFSTDAAGVIVDWTVQLSGSPGAIVSNGPPVPGSDIIDSGSGLGGFGRVTGTGSGATAQGSWVHVFVPEPSTAGLLLLGLFGLARAGRQAH